MKKKWNVIPYETESGKVPVMEFLDTLPQKHQEKAFRTIDLLRDRGTYLPMPHAKQISGELWELRTQFSSDISRVFYFAHTKNTFVLLHGFAKKTQKTPGREIIRAQRYLEDWKRRHPNDL